MAQNPNQQQPEFDIHDTNAVLTKFVQLRQAIRQLDDDITGLIYVAVNQLQKEQKAAREAQMKAAEEAKKKAEEKSKPK
jgi:hypothetical protein